ncbi:DinB family protein [Mucilaginibacter sabulilitoris]|uniref:DinB family protein n=1 Tax=Mucilaginibacter sabulilitoris TaxID=1173583 RepID=A0ABZ0TDN4_9SPHI|nr:DinB family protein [Mucilaginibacter sabulilitoris]WPU91320.1 DinB family protein [Mucilaginibacter sabulilitoris]
MNDTIQLLSDTINAFLAVRRQEVEWEIRPSPSKWSNKEIIGHLTDSAQINLQRFIRCTYEENFKLTYEQDAWVAVQHYQDADINELLNLWKLLNNQIIRVLKNYPANRLSARCDNSKQEPNLQTVQWLAADYVAHLKHHLKQIM